VILLLLLTGFFAESGKATIYYPGDGHCGTIKANGKTFKRTDSHIAHRWLPLGTSGVLCNLRTKRCTRTIVEDRGPWGAVIPCARYKKDPTSRFPARKIGRGKRCRVWQTQIKLKDGWSRRGSFDITVPVAKAIHHQAWDTVVFIYSKEDKGSRHLTCVSR
jgi:hypothetical protein